jgi:flagellar assembly protein FliH
MGRVVPGTPLSGLRYQIGVPVPKRDLEASAIIAEESVPFDLQAVIRASHRIVDDSSNDARTLINDARERAKSIVNKALEMASELEEKGYQDGIERATTEQDAAMLIAVQEARDAMQNVVEMVRNERRQFFLNAERDIIELAVSISKKIIQREVETSSDVTTNVVRAALKRLSERDQVTIRVSPDDLEAIRTHRDEFLNEGDIQDLRIVSDPRVDRGGVIIETDSGSIDGRLDAQLNMAQDALVQSMDPTAYDVKA